MRKLQSSAAASNSLQPPHTPSFLTPVQYLPSPRASLAHTSPTENRLEILLKDHHLCHHSRPDCASIRRSLAGFGKSLVQCFEHAVSCSLPLLAADKPSFSTQESRQRRSLAGPPGRWGPSRPDPSESSLSITAQTFRSANVKADANSDSLGVKRMEESASLTSGLLLASRHPTVDCDHLTLRHHMAPGSQQRVTWRTSSD